MESKTHKKLKRKLAGKTGKNEVKRKNKRFDVLKSRKVIEIEKSGKIKKAIQRLKTAKKLKKELRVPQKDFKKAIKQAKKLKIKKITIKNFKGSKIKYL